MPGDDWQKLAKPRLLYGHMYGMLAKKRMFMGSEFGQIDEWQHDSQSSWQLLESPGHVASQWQVAALNGAYAWEPALDESDCDSSFEWIDANDSRHSESSFLRKSRRTNDVFAVIWNFTPVPRGNYRIGVPRGGFWREVLNSDALKHGGSGYGNFNGVEAAPVDVHGRPLSLSSTLPPLGAVFLKAPE